MESAEKKVLPPQISEIGICLGPFSPSQARRASDLYGSDPRIYLIDRISKFLQLEIMDADDEAEFYGADMHIDLLWDDFLNDVRDDCNDFGVENSEILWADIDSTGDNPLIDWVIETYNRVGWRVEIGEMVSENTLDDGVEIKTILRFYDAE